MVTEIKLHIIYLCAIFNSEFVLSVVDRGGFSEFVLSVVDRGGFSEFVRSWWV